MRSQFANDAELNLEGARASDDITKLLLLTLEWPTFVHMVL